MITVLATLPLFLFTGAAIDFARQVQMYRSLQNATDEATIAAASLLSEPNASTDIPPLVTAYLNAATSGLSAKIQAPKVQVTANSVTVTVSASIGTTFLDMVEPTLPATVAATAVGPQSTVSVTATPNGDVVADLNTIYIYALAADGTKNFSGKVELLDNSIYGTITTAQQENVTVNGVCANVTPTSPYKINPTCLELNGQTMNIVWNDMGNLVSVGDNDQYVTPYQDMTYSFTCSGSRLLPGRVDEMKCLGTGAGGIDTTTRGMLLTGWESAPDPL